MWVGTVITRFNCNTFNTTVHYEPYICNKKLISLLILLGHCWSTECPCKLNNNNNKNTANAFHPKAVVQEPLKKAASRGTVTASAPYTSATMASEFTFIFHSSCL